MGFHQKSMPGLMGLAWLLAACSPAAAPATSIPMPPLTATSAAALPLSSTALARYTFPQAIDPAKRYLFYLHGKIIEDQGIQAVSPDFGPYEYEAILERLSQPGFVVISEPRLKNMDSQIYAAKVVKQVEQLLKAGVPAQNITIAGASKGAGIAVEVSHLLQNEAVNYVLLSICHPDNVAAFKQNGTTLSGNVLSIYDSFDTLAGSCQELFAFSQGKGLSRSKEIVLKVGTGHGILYKPLDEWIIPLIQWAGNP